MKKAKTLIIGWDAADWQVIDPLLEAGEMPSLSRLVNRGVRGNLATLQPVLSPLLWTSIATGKPAYEHGILGFVQAGNKPGEIVPVQADKRKAKAFWNVLNEAEINCQVVNWWPSHPVERVKGAMVSNQFCQWPERNASNWPVGDANVHPPSMGEKLANLRMLPTELTLAHLQPFFPKLNLQDFQSDELVAQVAAVLAKCASVHNIITELMAAENWECAAVYYEALDHFSHLAMKYHPPKLKGISTDDFERYQYVIRAAYRFHDMMLDRLLELAGPQCNVILISDHGFQSGALRTASLPDLPAAPALEHRSYGVFCAAGPAFKQGEKIFGATLLDICPTILHLHGLPVGEDMPGRVIGEAFQEDRMVGEIPSWENTGAKPQFYATNNSVNVEVMAQLEALGYVDLPENDRVKAVTRDWQYNEALSLMHGGKSEEALKIARQLHAEKSDLRGQTLLADLLLKTNRHADFQELIEHWPEAVLQHPYGRFLKGLHALQKGETGEALKAFEAVADKGIESIALQLEICKCLVTLGRYDEAKQYAEKILAVEPENAAGLTIMAEVSYQQDDYAYCLALLEKSLELQFFQPHAHYLMGATFNSTGEVQAAKQALNEALRQAPKHEKAAQLLRNLQAGTKQENRPETIIVTGFPRSGTSMMMKILGQGGISIKADQQRASDRHNPEGYYEWSPIKKLGQEPVDFSGTDFRAIKVVAPLLRFLPANRNYRIIWLERPLLEVIISQEKMKGNTDAVKNFPFQLAVQLEEEQKRMQKWLSKQPNINWQAFSYHEILTRPAAEIKRLAKFLERPLKEEKAASAVKPQLHRNKIG